MPRRSAEYGMHRKAVSSAAVAAAAEISDPRSQAVRNLQLQEDTGSQNVLSTCWTLATTSLIQPDPGLARLVAVETSPTWSNGVTTLGLRLGRRKLWLLALRLFVLLIPF